MNSYNIKSVKNVKSDHIVILVMDAFEQQDSLSELDPVFRDDASVAGHVDGVQRQTSDHRVRPIVGLKSGTRDVFDHWLKLGPR